MYRDKQFDAIWRRFQNSTPKTYQRISLQVCLLTHGPEFPDKAFADLDTLEDWYRAILSCWLSDSLAIADYWRGRLKSQQHELALCHVVLEARNTGVRRIQRRIFREQDGVPRYFGIKSYSELSQWCDFMFELLDDDERHVEQERHFLTIRYDKGVVYRLEEERKDWIKEHGKEVAQMTYSMMKTLSKSEPRMIEPDDDWLLVVWSSLANAKQSIRETAVNLFVDTKPEPKRPHVQLLEDIIAMTWKAMRQIGPVCREEPVSTNPKQIRRFLDAVKRFCTRQKERDFNAFLVSAKGETSTRNFQKWAGGKRVTLAIVFTDVVDSTVLGEEIRDEAMNEVRRAHFAQSRKLIGEYKGREIKTIGDSFMVAFKSVDAALDFARGLQENSGHPRLQIRAGIHIGSMQVEEGDVFGGTVNFAARVVGTIKGAEIWLSDRAKKDIEELGAERHKLLKWKKHSRVSMKGFPDVFTLWSLKESPK